MTLVEVKGDIGMATLVPDPDLIQVILFSIFYFKTKISLVCLLYETIGSNTMAVEI